MQIIVNKFIFNFDKILCKMFNSEETWFDWTILILTRSDEDHTRKYTFF